MLVLTRRPNRGSSSIIIIGDKIELQVIATESGNVKLGITAPEHMNIRGGAELECIPRKRPVAARPV
jgi:carbon storage regulator CsrA